MIQVGSIGDFEIISKLIPHLLFPGVWESLQADLEIVKGLGGKASSEVEPSEEEFLPLSESSRLSLSDSVSVASNHHSQSSAEKIPKVECLRAPGSPVLPPLSPRLPLSGEDLSPSTETGRDGVFFLEKNIDGLPERNLASPRSHQVSAGSQSSSQSGKIQTRSPSRPLSLSLLSHRTGWSCSSQLSLGLASTKMRRRWWLPSVRVLPG